MSKRLADGDERIFRSDEERKFWMAAYVKGCPNFAHAVNREKLADEAIEGYRARLPVVRIEAEPLDGCFFPNWLFFGALACGAVSIVASIVRAFV